MKTLLLNAGVSKRCSTFTERWPRGLFVTVNKRVCLGCHRVQTDRRHYKGSFPTKIRKREWIQKLLLVTYPAGYESSEWRRKKKKERKKHDETPARFIVHHQQIAGQSLMKPWWIYGSRKLHKCLIKLFWKWRSRSHGVRFSLFISTVDTIHHVQRVDLKSSISFSEVALFILTAFASGGGFRLSTFYNNRHLQFDPIGTESRNDATTEQNMFCDYFSTTKATRLKRIHAHKGFTEQQTSWSRLFSHLMSRGASGEVPGARRWRTDALFAFECFAVLKKKNAEEEIFKSRACLSETQLHFSFTFTAQTATALTATSCSARRSGGRGPQVRYGYLPELDRWGGGGGGGGPWCYNLSAELIHAVLW